MPSNNEIMVAGLVCLSAVTAVAYLSKSDDITESFWNGGSFTAVEHPMSSKVLSDRMKGPKLREDFPANLKSGQVKNFVQENYQQKSSNFMTQPGTYQSALSPRMGIPEGLKSFTKMNGPPRSMMAVPENPLSAAMQVENYQPSYETVKPCANAQPSEPSLSIGEQNPVVFDRLVFSNKHSRLRGAGDYIRGDLPIVPDLDFKNGWFRPSVRPGVDLNTGALAVIGGIEGSEPVAKLAIADSGGVLTSRGGVSYQSPINMGNQYVLSGTGVPESEMASVTSFP